MNTAKLGSKALPDHLPINAVLSDISDALLTHNELVLEAPPGAGKTTIVPLSLRNAPWLTTKSGQRQKIVMLEPRRMAARNAAEHMASLLGEPVGQTVGYRIRQESKVTSHTQIEVITEGILTRWLQTDPSLEGIGLVIFDEFHERSLDTDFGLALCQQGRQLFRDEDSPLKLLVMSATLDGEQVAQYLDNAPRITSAGKMFPVGVSYLNYVLQTRDIAEPVARSIHQALQEQPGNLLVFLPGQREITAVQNQLKTLSPEHLVVPLYGSLPLKEQRKAILPPKEAHQRKIVLATDIAETSLTIEGVRVVIDSGLARKPAFDPNTGMTRLFTTRISKASSVQRMGRAGRIESGHCYRLWSEDQQQQLAEQSPPEIHQADLCPLVLQMQSFGAATISDLDWIEKPPQAAFEQAQALLCQLGALERYQGPESKTPRHKAQHYKLTKHGQTMAALPTHPRIAHLLVCSKVWGQQALATQLAAILTERAPTRLPNLQTFIQYIANPKSCPANHKAWQQRTAKQAQTFARILKAGPAELPVSPSDLTHTGLAQPAGLLLALAFPDRIAKRRDRASTHPSDTAYQLSNGRIALLDAASDLAAEKWLAVAELGGIKGRSEDRIYSAVALTPDAFEDELCHLTDTRECVEWDTQKNRFIAEERVQVGALILQQRQLERIPLGAKQDALAKLIRKQGLQILPWSDQTRQWQARVELLRHALPTHSPAWPDVSHPELLAGLEAWLLPHLDAVTKLNDLKNIDLDSILQTLLPWPLPKELTELAPTHYAVPTGSKIRINYANSPPSLEVKLQEMFGCETTPSIAKGQVSLMIHLLSPAKRPLQITQDLAGFWAGSYHDVKKEMKGRYPKHPWPDNPATAIPTRYTKKRKH